MIKQEQAQKQVWIEKHNQEEKINSFNNSEISHLKKKIKDNELDQITIENKLSNVEKTVMNTETKKDKM